MLCPYSILSAHPAPRRHGIHDSLRYLMNFSKFLLNSGTLCSPETRAFPRLHYLWKRIALLGYTYILLSLYIYTYLLTTLHYIVIFWMIMLTKNLYQKTVEKRGIYSFNEYFEKLFNFRKSYALLLKQEGCLFVW